MIADFLKIILRMLYSFTAPFSWLWIKIGSGIPPLEDGFAVKGFRELLKRFAIILKFKKVIG
ncbi:MAG: hypothetical protein DRN47_06630 [Candidatus Wolframiiraptor sp.]|nr:MAG: hypothetical protein DRN47_06630 [Candidatus Wolframiiraptor sp.]